MTGEDFQIIYQDTPGVLNPVYMLHVRLFWRRRRRNIDGKEGHSFLFSLLSFCFTGGFLSSDEFFFSAFSAFCVCLLLLMDASLFFFFRGCARCLLLFVVSVFAQGLSGDRAVVSAMFCLYQGRESLCYFYSCKPARGTHTSPVWVYYVPSPARHHFIQKTGLDLYEENFTVLRRG